jgi:hypothetical protein
MGTRSDWRVEGNQGNLQALPQIVDVLREADTETSSGSTGKLKSTRNCMLPQNQPTCFQGNGNITFHIEAM